MKDFKKMTVDEWLDFVDGRGDWCYKPNESKNSISAMATPEFLHDELHSQDLYDRNRARFLNDLYDFIN